MVSALSSASLFFPGWNHTQRIMETKPYPIRTGSEFPNTVMYRKNGAGAFEKFEVWEALRKRNVVIFTTPNLVSDVSMKHLLGYVRLAADFKDMKVDQIACLATYNFEIMHDWAKEYNAKKAVALWPDFTAELAWKTGLAEYQEGIGIVFPRIAMYVENGLVKRIHTAEDSDICGSASAGAMLSHLVISKS